MLVLVATCMTLSLMLVTVSSLITYMSGDPLFEIFIALNAVVIGAIIFRGRITKSLARMAGSAGQRLAGARIGGTEGPPVVSPGGGRLWGRRGGVALIPGASPGQHNKASGRAASPTQQW